MAQLHKTLLQEVRQWLHLYYWVVELDYNYVIILLGYLRFCLGFFASNNTLSHCVRLCNNWVVSTDCNVDVCVVLCTPFVKISQLSNTSPRWWFVPVRLIPSPAVGHATLVLVSLCVARCCMVAATSCCCDRCTMWVVCLPSACVCVSVCLCVRRRVRTGRRLCRVCREKGVVVACVGGRGVRCVCSWR